MKKKSLLSRFLSPTPKKWKKIRNTAAGLLAAIAGLGGLNASITEIMIPKWFIDYEWYIISILSIIIAYAQSKEGKDK